MPRLLFVKTIGVDELVTNKCYTRFTNRQINDKGNEK